MKVGSEFFFDSSHYLPGYKGKCEQFHGHTYKLEVTITGEKDKSGMILDFNELKKVVYAEVIEKLDHKNLNDIFKNPTAENICSWIYEALEKKLDLYSVKLWEGRGKWVELCREKE